MRIFIKIIIFLLAVAGLAVAAAWLIPVRLDVGFADGADITYATITRKDVEVVPMTIFGRGSKEDNFVFTKESTDGYDDIIITYGLLQERIHMRQIDLDVLEAVYTEPVRDGDAVDEANISVTATFRDGHTEDVRSFKVYGENMVVDRSNTVMVGTDYGAAPLEFTFVGVEEIRAEYATPAYEGGLFDPDAVKVDLVYEDGHVEDAGKATCEGAQAFTGISDYVVYTKYGKTELRVVPAGIRYAKADGTYYAGQEFSGSMQVYYDDGTEKTVSTEDVAFPEGAVLSAGTNSIPFTMNGARQVLYVNAKALNTVSMVRQKSADEITSSIYNSLTDRLFVTIRKIDAECPYIITHIAINDPAQLCVTAANGIAGSGLEAADSAAIRTGWALGANGSFFDTATGAPLSGCLIRGGAIIGAGETTGREICITSGGSVFSPPAGIPAQELISAGVRDILVTTDPLLIQDGVNYVEGNIDIAGKYPRTAFGMVSPGEYYIVTAEGDGLTYAQLQQVFSSLGCTYARPLDGGNSVSLMFGRQKVTEGELRPVADFLYFMPQ